MWNTCNINTRATSFYRAIELELSKDAKPLLKAKILKNQEKRHKMIKHVDVNQQRNM